MMNIRKSASTQWSRREALASLAWMWAVPGRADETSSGPFGADIPFSTGLNVLWADNTKGKSTSLQGLLYALGLERMLMYLTGMKNIRDVIAFPRTPGSAEF